QALHMIELVEQTPRSLDVLLAYKPIPTMGLERRSIAALLGIHGDGKMPQPEAEAALKAIDSLAKTATRIGPPLAGTLKPADTEAWGGSAIEAWDLKLRAMMTAQASHLAAGNTVEPRSLARLH